MLNTNVILDGWSMVQGQKVQTTTTKTNQLATQGNNQFAALQGLKDQELTIAITTMEHVLTRVEETNKEKHQPVIIESKRIPLRYLAKDGYYYKTKEEALVATNKEAMVNKILTEVKEGSCDIQSVLDAINRMWAARLIKQVIHNVKAQSKALIKRVIDKAKKAVLINQIIRNPEVVQCWRNSWLKKLMPITITPTKQVTPQLKRYVTGSNAIPLKQNRYLEKIICPAEPLDQSTRSNEASLEKAPSITTAVKATIAKAIQYNKSAKSLLWSKRCYKCQGMDHQAKDCPCRWPQELPTDQDDVTPSLTYQPLLHLLIPADLLPEEHGRSIYRPARYVNLTDSPVFGKQGNDLPPAGNITKWARSQSPKTYRNFPGPNEGQLPHRYERPVPSDWQEDHDHKQARTLSPMRTIQDESQIGDDTSDLKTENNDKTEQIRRLHVHLETFDQEQTWEALQNLLERNLGDANWQLAHIVRLQRTITDDQVYMSACKSMTVRFYMHSAKKWAEGIALIDSGATENFMSLNYAQWLGLPIKRLEKPRRLFNVDRTENKAGKLQFYTNVSLQTGTKHTNHWFFLSDLGEVKAIFSYPWFADTQPKIDWSRGWIDSSQLPIILWSPDVQKAQFIAKDSRTAIRRTIEGTTIRRAQIWPTAWEAIWQIIAKGRLCLFIRNLQIRQAKQDILPEELKTIPQEYHRHLKVFSEKAAAHLPPDHPWNHAIELKPDAPASIRGRIYPLTQLENEALEKHIKE